MKQLMLLLSFCLGLLVANGQAWSIYNPSDTLYYINHEGHYRSLFAVENTPTPFGTTYKPYRTVTIDSDCNASADNETRNPKSPIWAGYSFHADTLGTFVFYNKAGTSITINTLAKVNDSWQWYAQNGDTIVATVVSADTAHLFPSVFDSVKTILLTVTSFTTTETQQWDSTFIRLSAYTGMIDAPVFFEFPDERRLMKRTIRKPMTYADLYKYGIGDYFQTVSSQTSYPSFSTSFHYNYYEILNKTTFNSGNSVTFTIKNESQYKSGGYVSQISIQTYQETYHNLSRFVGTGIPQGFSNYVENIDYISDNTGNALYSNRRNQKIDHSEFQTQRDSCLFRNLYRDMETTIIAYECLGILTSTSGIGGTSDEYVSYANLCGNTYGSKIVLSPTPVGLDLEPSIHLTIFPNPTSKQVSFQNQSEHNFKATILSAQGHVVGEVTTPAFTMCEVDVSNLTNGIYLVRFSGTSGSFFKKLVVNK